MLLLTMALNLEVNLGEVDDYTFSTQQSSRKINIGNIYPNGGDPNQ